MDSIVIDIIIPVYKNYDEIVSLINSCASQEKVKINKIICPLTLSGEEIDYKIKKYFEENSIVYFEMKSEEFSHSLTREKAIKEYAESKVVILMSQDIKLVNNDSLYHLAKDVASGEVAYAYGRQICPKKSLEKYIRDKNYPDKSYFVTKDDIEKMQVMAFFSSDAFSALDRDIFIKIGGYQGYDIMMSEDMLYSYFVLQNGYKKEYVADACVIHFHHMSLKQLYNRYYDTGVFYQKVTLFNNYKSTESGAKLAMYVLKQCFKHFYIKGLFRWLPDMTSRYLGMRKGKKAKLAKEGK